MHRPLFHPYLPLCNFKNLELSLAHVSCHLRMVTLLRDPQTLIRFNSYFFITCNALTTLLIASKKKGIHLLSVKVLNWGLLWVVFMCVVKTFQLLILRLYPSNLLPFQERGPLFLPFLVVTPICCPIQVGRNRVSNLGSFEGELVIFQNVSKECFVSFKRADIFNTWRKTLFRH